MKIDKGVQVLSIQGAPSPVNSQLSSFVKKKLWEKKEILSPTHSFSHPGPRFDGFDSVSSVFLTIGSLKVCGLL